MTIACGDSHTSTHGALGALAFGVGTSEVELVLKVSNAGEPIPKESLAKIFEPFWRHSIDSDRKGLGLGLSICSQIVRAHNGDLSVTSTRELGTTFTARIPVG